MGKQKRRPIPTTYMISAIMLIISIMLFKYEQHVSAILSLILVGIIILIELVLLPCSTIFFREKITRRELSKYKNFARLYLKSRRVTYSKKTFEDAIEANWLDIVTMCLLLGIQQAYSDVEKEHLFLHALHYDHRKIFEILIKGGFKANFIVSETGEYFLFETLKQSNTFYLELLLKRKIDPNLLDSLNQTAIFIAIKEGLNEHIKILLKYNCDLTLCNWEGLTPILYAVKEGNIEACELISAKLNKVNEPHQIAFKKFNEPIMINPPTPNKDIDIILKLVSSKDKETLRVLKKYFTDKKNYFMTVDTGVELYTRLSYVEALMEKQEVITDEVQEMFTEESCKKDLYTYILKKYKFKKIGQFNIDNIYKKPKCIDSFKETCKTCSGTGGITCSKCEGIGIESCDSCLGTGQTTCSKCNGTLKISCKIIKKYKECPECQDGIFTCTTCDDTGMAECPECQAHGTTKCHCPNDKKISCPHCDNGYIFVKGEIYKKCPHCINGKICGLCHNTGWVNERFKDKGYLCKTCKGKKVIVCKKCKGKKKVKCAKQFELDCDCKTGKQVCIACGGTTKVPCKQCLGTKVEKCPECIDGYIYTNVHIDFKATQVLQQEMLLGKSNQHPILSDLLNSIQNKVCENSEMIEEVYTLLKIDMQPDTVTIRNNYMQQQISNAIAEKSQKGIVDILEMIPLKYTVVTFKQRDGETYKSILVGNTFYKTYMI